MSPNDTPSWRPCLARIRLGDYVTAFMNFTDFKKYASEIVWESEVWVAAFPDHMIHFNGEKFLGLYPPRNKEDEE